MTPALLGLLLSHTHHFCQQGQTSACQVYVRDEIAFLMGFYGLLRRSEIIAFKLSDVTLVDESEAGAYIKLRTRKSKTDQQAREADVIVIDISRHGVKIMERRSRWVGLWHAGHVSKSPLVPACLYDDRVMSAEPLKNGNALALREMEASFGAAEPELYRS